MLASKIYFALLCCISTPIFAFISQEDFLLEDILADCILNISKTYFDHDLPTVVQTPETWRRYGIPIDTHSEKFLEKLNTNSQIPLVTVGYIQDDLRIAQQNLVKPGSYIMKVPELQTRQDQYWTIHMFRRFHINVHNARGRMILALNYVCSVDELVVSKALLDWAYGHSFHDVVVVIPESTPKNVSKLNIYGWLSEDQQNVCVLRIGKVRRFDTWLAEEKYFILNTNLFPTKTKINKNQCRVTVFYGNVPPFSMENLGTELVGVIPEILKYGITPNFEPADNYHENSYNLRYPLDFSSYLEYRECALTYPLFAVNSRWYVPIGKKIAPWRSLYKAFTPGMWSFVLFTSISGNLFLGLIQKAKKLFFGATDNLDNIVTIVVLTHLGVGVKDCYTGPASVLLFSLLLFYCLLINTAYQSTLFGLMVEPGEYPPIQTIDELKASKLVLKSYALVYDYQKFTLKYENYEYCGEDCFREITENSEVAVLLPESVGEIFRDLTRQEHGEYKVTAIREIADTQYYGIDSDKYNCIINDILETIIFRAADSGLIDKWNKYYFTWWKIEVHSKFEDPEIPALSLWHLQGAFYVLVLGVLGSIIIFIAETFKYSFTAIKSWAGQNLHSV
ncbi:Ionotropic receptor 376 [Blattella germanica]|nr:Ionotropic receptor 376 [Blattella germanica]